MSETIAVMGLGHMGAALAAALLEAGETVTVWNRTAARAAPLAAAGASVAETPAEAIAAGSIVVICLGTYSDAWSVLDDCPPLIGKTLVQLTTGTARDAQAMEQWTLRKGGRYLDGVILAYPSGIGARETMLAMTGSEEAWRGAERILMHLGGSSAHLGSNHAAPIALEAALTAPMLLVQMGVIRGAHLLEQAGQDLQAYADTVAGAGPLFAEAMRRQVLAISDDRFDGAEARLGTWAAALKHNPDAFGGDGDFDLLAPVRRWLGEAVARGHGDEELAAAIKILRDRV